MQFERLELTWKCLLLKCLLFSLENNNGQRITKLRGFAGFALGIGSSREGTSTFRTEEHAFACLQMCLPGMFTKSGYCLEVPVSLLRMSLMHRRFIRVQHIVLFYQETACSW